jgi:DNA-binding transcriptional LysR family regulator
LDDLPSLALFARVVHHRSFSAAAREAGIAKSAVSRRVARLEEQLGVRLLRRSTRTLSVTEEGLRVYEHCAALVASATAAADAAGATRDTLRGTLRVNAPVTFAQMHLAAAVASFLQENAEVSVHLSTEDRIVDVVEGGFDVVLRVGRLADSGLAARRIATDRLVVCASPAYLARAGEPETPADLVRHNCLHYALVPLAGEWRFRDAGGPVSLPVRGNLVSTDGTVLREAALAGLGLAVLPSFMVAREVAEGRLRLVLEGRRRAEIGIFAVVAHRAHAPRRVRAFLDFLVKHFGRARWEAFVASPPK